MQPIEPTQQTLGARLRSVRKNQQLSLVMLSQQSGVSVSMLSHIERGQTMPSLKTLDKICQALNIEMPVIFPPREPETITQDIVRKENRAQLEFPSYGLVKELLSPNSSKSLEFFMISMEPEGGSGPEYLVRNGEKAGLVVEGQLELTIGERRYNLNAGDSFQFDSGQPHRIYNNTKKPAKLLWIIRPDQIRAEI